jgi:hypothetical protein
VVLPAADGDILRRAMSGNDACKKVKTILSVVHNKDIPKH